MTRFDLLYINLDRATGRREAIERSIASSHFSDRWSFFRYAAVAADSDRVRNAPGRISDSYKGNFLSHRHCLQLSLKSDAHLFVAEDDAMFCPQTGPLLENIVDTLPEDSWDILRTEITLLSATDIPKFYKMCMSEEGGQKIRLLDLSGFMSPYSGASTYVVNRKSKLKFVHAIDQALERRNGHYDFPFDSYLADMVRHSVLRGFVTVPFLTAPSFDEDESQAPQMFAGKPLSEDETVRRFNKVHRELQTAFRRLVWVGFRPDTVLPPGYEGGDQLFRMTDQDRLFQKLASWFLILQGNIPYASDLKLLDSFSIGRFIQGQANGEV